MPLKRLKFDQSVKKTEEQKNRITDPLVFFQMFPKSMTDAYTSKYIPILIKYFLKINGVFVKALILNFNTSYDRKKLKHHEMINNFVQLF